MEEKQTKKPAHGHDGHRARLIEKLKADALCEHEYLEALLFNAIPRRNTNDIAHKLLAEFGEISEVLNATMDRLLSVEGVGKSVASYLYCIGKIVRSYMKSDACERKRPKYFERTSFLSFVKEEYKTEQHEVMEVFLLDKHNQIFMRKRFSSKEIGAVSLLPEELVRTISQENATGIVLVHNHPLGDCQPSKQDDVTTKKIQMLCALNNVILCEHFIYSPSGVYSYFESGKLADFSKQLARSIN